MAASVSKLCHQAKPCHRARCAIKPSLLCQQEASSFCTPTKAVATPLKHARRPNLVTDFMGSVTTHSSGSSCTTSKSWGDTCARRLAVAGVGLRGRVRV